MCFLSSPCPSQKAEESSQIYAGALPAPRMKKIMGDTIAMSGGSWLICAFGFAGRVFLSFGSMDPTDIPFKDLDFISLEEHFFVLQVGSDYQ